MKKILFVIHQFNYGGAAKSLSIIANSLSSQYDVTVFSYLKSEKCYELNSSIKFHCACIDRTNKVKKYISPIFSIRKEIKAEKPDVVIAFLNNASFYSLLAGLGCNCKVIICERCDPYNENSMRLRFMRKFFPLASGAVFQTEGAREYYRHLLNKSVVIPNMVDKNLKNIRPKSFCERDNEISVFSRLEVRQKRQDILLKAFQIVSYKHPEIVLKIYGDGPDLNYLIQLRQELGLDEKVFFCGKTNNSINILSRAKLTVSTSDYEGIPNAVLDALAIGIPCVATDASPGGVRLLIHDGYDGLIVPCDDYRSVANAILYLLDHPEAADEISVNSRDVNSRFSQYNLADNWRTFIENTCRGTR